MSALEDQRKLWDQLAEYGAERSVLDPGDDRGLKNAYIRFTVTRKLAEVFGGGGHPGTLLDFGCGSGRNSGFLSQMGNRVIGLDISAELLSLTIRDNPENVLFMQYDGSSIPLQDDVIDGGFTNGVLICLTSRELVEQALRELFRVLKPGGRMVFIEQVRRRRRILFGGTKVQRTRSEYMGLFCDAGFTVIGKNVIRRGHFPLVYAIRYGLVPLRMLPWIAKLEAFLGACFEQAYFDYAVTAFICEKPRYRRSDD